MGSYLCFSFCLNKNVIKKQCIKCEHSHIFKENIDMLIPPLTRVNLVESKESEKSQPVLLDQEMPVETAVNFIWKLLRLHCQMILKKVP